jgi:hypothetical protein
MGTGMPSRSKVGCDGMNGDKFITDCSMTVIVVYFQRHHLMNYLTKVVEQIPLRIEVQPM